MSRERGKSPMFFRFVLTAVAVYFGYRFFKGIWTGQAKNEEVRGKSKSAPLDLRDVDVEDASFEDLDDSK